MCHKKFLSLLFSVLVLGTLVFFSVDETEAKSRIWSRIKNFLGATVAPGLDGPVDSNDTRFGCKPGGSYSDTVWCQAYGGTFDLHVAEAAKHQGIVVMVQRTYTDGSGRGYFMTGDYGPAVPSATYGNLASNAVVHCPTGATTGNHTRGHMIYSPNLRGMFDVGGETHFWCIQNGVAVNPLPGPEAGQIMPDIHSKTSITKLTQDGRDYFKYAWSNNSLNTKIQALASNGYVKCLYGKSGPFGTDQHYHCLTPDGSAEADIDWNNTDIMVAGEAPPNYTLTVSAGAGSVEVKAGARANSKFMLWNSGAAMSFLVSCTVTPQAAGEIQNANTTEPAFSGTAITNSVPLPASAGKNFIYSVDVSTLPVGIATVTCTAKAPNEATGKSATDTVTLIAPVLHAAPDANYPTGFTTALTQYGANKYSITLGDVDGIKDFTVVTKTGGAGSVSIYSGSPGAPGNLGACGGTSMFKTITSGTVTLESTDFLLMASLTDCRTGATKYDYKIGMPSGGGTEPVPTQPIACSNGVKCPKGSWCSNGQKFYYPTSEITCVAWSIDGTQIPTPTGTTECDPADSMCVNTGQTVDYSSTKWCGRGMRYFSKDGLKMTCVAWNAEAPIGFSACSPTETTCKGKGDTWTKDDLKASQYYCSNAKKCTLADGGGSCVGNSEACPAGSKYCQATDTNCLEPGTYRSLPTGTGTQQWFWCGGGGMQFYSSTQVYCEGTKTGGTTPAIMMFTGADIKAVLAKLGSGWQLCNPQQTSSYGKCLEPGQVGRSEDWCAWWPPQPPVPGPLPMAPVFHDPNKPKACPNLDGITPTVPEPEKPVTPPDPELPCPSFAMSPPICAKGQILKFTEGKCRMPYCADEGGGGEPIKPPSSCAIGETCPSSSWCNMSKQCYYPDGKLTCARWEDSCPKGTKACSPGDTKCIEPGATGPNDGWCKDSMECFVDGKKFCQPMPMGMGMMHEPPQCPAGSKLCPPNDTNCIEPGKTGPLNGWCKNAMECYSSDGKEKLCQAWKPMTGAGSVTTPAIASSMMMDDSCPSGYKKCRPDDKYCVELGETSKPDNKNGWCAGGRQCYKPDNTFYCAKWSEECPKDSKVCRPDDQGCVEPGKSTTKTDGWCGGNAVRCNNKDVKTPGFTCIAVNTMNDPAAWEKVACPAGTSRCSTSDSGCMEFGEKRTPGDSRGSLRFAWCTSGMKRENADGSVECVSFNDYQQKPVTPDPDKEKPEDKFCIQVSAIAYDPSTKVCKEFSTPCKIPNAWKEISSNEKCQDGKLVEFLDALQEVDYNGFGQLLADERKHLDDLYVRLKVLPPSVAAGKTIRAKIEDSVKLLKKLGQETFKKSRKLADLQTELGTYRSATLKDIDSSFDALKSNIAFTFLVKDLGKRLADYELEWKAQDSGSDYAMALKDGISKLRDLLKSAESQTGTALDQIIAVIKEVSSGLESLVSENHSGVTSDYLDTLISSLTESVEKLQTFIDEKEVKDNKIEFMMGKLYAILSDLEEGEQGLGAGDLSRKLDEGTTIVQRVSKWLADYGLTKQEKVEAKVEEAFAHLEVKLQKRVDEMLDKFANKVEVIVNEALKKVAENAAIVSERLEKVVLQVKDQLAQSLANLTAVPPNHRDAITETKNVILSNVEDVEKRLETAKLAPDLSERLRVSMATAATLNWCGEVAEQVKAWMTRTNLALEAKTLAEEQVANFETDMGKLTGKNNEECYRIGAAAFRDVPTHEWYYAATEYNKSNDYIKGYADSRGNSTGKFGPADPTLRVEALAMAMRIYGVPLGDTDTLAEVIPGVPPWGVTYVNGALKAGFEFDEGLRLDEPITRAQCAGLFAKLGGDKVDLSSPVDSAAKYKDYAEFKNDPETVKAIDALSDLEILKGSGGFFHPNDPLVRSEFATINQRVVTNLGLEKEEEK